MYKIAVFGSADEAPKEIAALASTVGLLLAQRNATILTGACPGVSAVVAASSSEHGGAVIGYSPAMNYDEHVNINKDPADIFSQIIYLDQSFEFPDSLQASYKYRNIRTAMACDAALVINGRMGTLNEAVLACEFGKILGVLEGTGGTADLLRDLLSELAWPEASSRVVFSREPEVLVDRIYSIIEGR